MHLPIDLFLTSLAHDRKADAIAVILSGTAADGAAGARAVRDEGGMTLAQEPAEAKYSAMPQNAVDTGAIDFVLPIELLARQLVTSGRSAGPQRIGGQAPAPVSPEDPLLGDLLALIRAATSADFSNYKQSTVLRRINRRITLRRQENLTEYIELLRGDRAEVDALYQDLLIRVTTFFRQPRVFEALKEKVFPHIVAAEALGQARFWVPGCSTGEEAYSLAIAWTEFLVENRSGKGPLPSLQVFASDINQQVIDKARAGVYPASIASDVSGERLERFFTRVEGGYQIAKSIRDCCVFSKHDLTRDSPFSKLDLVSLRNVLIYLGPLLQRRVIPLLHFGLRPGGFLLLGESESIGAFTDLFSIADAKTKLYVRRDGVAVVVPSAPAPAVRIAAATGPARPAPGFDVAKEADRIVLETYGPVGVIVDPDMTVRQIRGRPGGYLQLGPGRATFDVIRLAREGLATELSSALREANRDQAPIRRENVRILRDGNVVAVAFDIFPIASPAGEVSFLVLFRDMPSLTEGAALAAGQLREDGDGTAREAADFERELVEMREYARGVVEDKEAANEELRSANEELQSANEELQSINEELEATSEEVQSANEELRTLNEELRSVNDRLANLNDELEHSRDFARTVVDTVREPLLVLGADLAGRFGQSLLLPPVRDDPGESHRTAVLRTGLRTMEYRRAP